MRFITNTPTMSKITEWKKLLKKFSLESTENDSSTSSQEKLSLNNTPRRKNKSFVSEISRKERMFSKHADLDKYPLTRNVLQRSVDDTNKSKNTMKKYAKRPGRLNEWKMISNAPNRTTEKCHLKRINLHEIPVAQTSNRFEKDMAILKKLSLIGSTPENSTDNGYGVFQKSKKHSESTIKNHHLNEHQKLKVSRKIFQTYKHLKNNDRKARKLTQFLKENSRPEWNLAKSQVFNMQNKEFTDDESENVSSKSTDDDEDSQDTIIRSVRHKNFRNAVEERPKKLKHSQDAKRSLKPFKQTSYSVISTKTSSSSKYRKTTLFEYFKKTKRISEDGSLGRHVSSEGVDPALNGSGFSRGGDSSFVSEEMEFSDEEEPQGCARSRALEKLYRMGSKRDEHRKKYDKNSADQVPHRKRLYSLPSYKGLSFLTEINREYEKKKLENSFHAKRKARRRSSSSSGSKIRRIVSDSWSNSSKISSNEDIRDEPKHILNHNKAKYNETRLLRRKSSSENSFKSRGPSFDVLLKQRNPSRLNTKEYKIKSSPNTITNYFSEKKLIHDDKRLRGFRTNINKDDFNRDSEKKETPKRDKEHFHSGSKMRRELFGEKKNFPENASRNVVGEKRSSLLPSVNGSKHDKICNLQKKIQRNLYSSEGFCESMSFEPPISGTSVPKYPHLCPIPIKSKKLSQDSERRTLTAEEVRELSPNFYVMKMCGSDAATLVNEIINSQKEECDKNSIEDKDDRDDDKKLSRNDLKVVKMKEIAKNNQTPSIKVSLSDPLSFGSPQVALSESLLRNKANKPSSKTNSVRSSSPNAKTSSQINIKRRKLDSQALEDLNRLHESNSWTNEALNSQKLNNNNRNSLDKGREHDSSSSLRKKPTLSKTVISTSAMTKIHKSSTSESSQKPNKLIDKNISSEIFATQSNSITHLDNNQEENQKSIVGKKNRSSQISESLKPPKYSESDLLRISREDPFIYKILTQDFEELENKEDLLKNAGSSLNEVKTDNSQTELSKKGKENLYRIQENKILTTNVEDVPKENQLKKDGSFLTNLNTELSNVVLYHGGASEKKLDHTQVTCADPFVQKGVSHSFEHAEDTLNKKYSSQHESAFKKLRTEHLQTNDTEKTGNCVMKGENLNHHQFVCDRQPYKHLKQHLEHISNQNQLKTSESSTKNQSINYTPVSSEDPQLQELLTQTFRKKLNENYNNQFQNIESSLKILRTEQANIQRPTNHGKPKENLDQASYNYFFPENNFSQKIANNANQVKSVGSCPRRQSMERSNLHSTYGNFWKPEEIDNFQMNSEDHHLQKPLTQEFVRTPNKSYENQLKNPRLFLSQRNINTKHSQGNAYDAALKSDRSETPLNVTQQLSRVPDPSLHRRFENTLNESYENQSKNAASSSMNQKTEQSRLNQHQTRENFRNWRDNKNNSQSRCQSSFPQKLMGQNGGNDGKQFKDVELGLREQKYERPKTNQAFGNGAERQVVEHSELSFADPYLQQLFTQNFVGTSSKNYEDKLNNPGSFLNERNINTKQSHANADREKSETKFNNTQQFSYVEDPLVHRHLTQNFKDNLIETYGNQPKNAVSSSKNKITEQSQHHQHQSTENFKNCKDNQNYSQSRCQSSCPQKLLIQNVGNDKKQLKDVESSSRIQRYEWPKTNQAFGNGAEREVVEHSELAFANPYLQQLFTQNFVGTSSKSYENQLNIPGSSLNERHINTKHSQANANSQKSEMKFNNNQQSYCGQDPLVHRRLTQNFKDNMSESYAYQSKNGISSSNNKRAEQSQGNLYQLTGTFGGCKDDLNCSQSRCKSSLPQKLPTQNGGNDRRQLENFESCLRKPIHEISKTSQAPGNCAERAMIDNSQLTLADPYLQQLLTQNFVDMLNNSYINQLKNSERFINTESSQASVYHATQNTEKLDESANHSQLYSEEPFRTEEENFLSQASVTNSTKKTKKTYNLTEDCILYGDNLLKRLLEERSGMWIRQSKIGALKRRTGGEAIDKMKTYIKRYKKRDVSIYKIKRRVIKHKEEDFRPPEDQVLDNLFKRLERDTSSSTDDDKESKSVSTPVSYITDETRSEVLSTGSAKLTDAQKLLRRGINKLSKDQSLLFSKHEDTIPKEFCKFEIVVKIERLINDVLDHYEQGRNPVFWIPRENMSNCFFADGRYQMKNPPDYTAVSFGVSSSRPKFNIILFLLTKIKTLLETDTKLTKREIYYQLKIMINAQWISDHALKDICRMLNVGLWALNILAQKGLVYGNLKLVMDTGEVLNCNVPGTLIPSDISKICEIQSTAYFILVVEKESIFHKLLEENLPNRLTRPFIMITGKGFPDLNTQLFLRKLWMVMSIPVFILVDADPDGIAIMLNYRFGSIANAHVSEHLAIPKARWLGVFPSEISRIKLPHQNLSKREISLTQKLLQLQCVQENEKIKKQLEKLLEHGYKTGIEGLVKSETYLSNCYLNWKFYSNDLI